MKSIDIIGNKNIHGNPVAAGSKLSVSTTAGTISEKNLIVSSDNYGYGTTRFTTQVINDLDPFEDDETDAVVTFDLNSPNGLMKRSISVHLLITY